jgi:hypothetical protein
LDSPGYELVDTNPTVFTNEAPVKVHVRRAQIFSRPTAEELSVELDKAQVVDYGPRPDARIVSLTLKFRSTANLPTPLEKIANLEIFTENGSRLWSAPLKVDRPYVIANPGLSTETFEAMVDRQKLGMLAGGRLAEITVKYDPVFSASSPVEYSTGKFSISPSTFEDLSSPAK